jgi:hypothetical protein
MCLENNVEKARNVKLLLDIYEKMSRLKINFEKIEVLLIGGDNDLALKYAEICNCQIGMFPLRYLGVSISARRLRVVDWANLEEKLAKKLDLWQGGSLFIGGRVILINACLTNSSIYHMSLFLLPKTVIEKLKKEGEDSFGRAASLRGPIIWLDGLKCVNPRKRGVWGLRA